MTKSKNKYLFDITPNMCKVFCHLPWSKFKSISIRGVEILGHATATYYKIINYIFHIDSNEKYFLVWKSRTKPKYLRQVPVLDTLELAAGIFCLFLYLLWKLQWVKNLFEEAFQFHAPIFSLYFSFNCFHTKRCRKVKRNWGASSKGWVESANSGWNRVGWSAKSASNSGITLTI